MIRILLAALVVAFATGTQAYAAKAPAKPAAYETDLDKKKAIPKAKLSPAAEKCAHDPICAKRARRDDLLQQLETARRKLATDQAAAADIPRDKAAITQIEFALKQLH